MEGRTAREYLEHLWTLEGAIKLKKLEEERLFDRATSTSPKLPDGMPHSSGGANKKFEISADAHMYAQEALNRTVSNFEAYRAEVIGNLGKLPTNQNGALYRYYLLHMSWEKTAESMNFSTRQILRIKKSGYKNLQKLLDAQKDVTKCH